VISLTAKSEDYTEKQRADGAFNAVSAKKMTGNKKAAQR